MTKKERLNEVYQHLKSKGYVHTQVEFAKKIGYNKTNMSSAFAGNEKYLTDSLFRKVCEVFPEINYDWLLTGFGNMLKSDSIVPHSAGESQNELLQVVKQQSEIASKLIAQNEEILKENKEIKQENKEMKQKIEELEKELESGKGTGPNEARIQQ